LSDLVAAIDSERQHGNLSSAKRIAQDDFVLVRPGLGRKDRQGASSVILFRCCTARRCCGSTRGFAMWRELFRLNASPRRVHEIDAATSTIFTKCLSCLRLRGVLGERKPSFGHFDEKGSLSRSAGRLRQPNALNSVVA